MITPSTLTLAKLKASSVKDVAGVCVNSDEFLTELNEIVDRLMTFGNWWNTVVKGRICTYSGCVTWPRQIGTILALNVCGRNRAIANKWFEFMPLDDSDCHAHRNWKSSVTGVDDGVSPVYSNIACGYAWKLRAYPRLQADRGKTMTIYGLDENKQEIMTKDQSGEWQMGEMIVLDTPYTETTKRFSEITRVSRDMTTGPVNLYQWDDVASVLLECASYEPSETEPRYRHMTIRNGCTTGAVYTSSSSSSCVATIEFLAKLQFIPVQIDQDIVQVDNIAAIKMMFQSHRLSAAGDDKGAVTKEMLAIKELNRVLNDKMPISQIPITIDPFGTAQPARAGIGRMQ